MIGQTKFRVSAILTDEGEVALKIDGSCSYGERNASVHRDITDEKLLTQVGGVLKKALTDVSDELNQVATAAAYECLVIATRRGEKI